MTSQYHNNNDSRPSQNTGLFVSNAGNKAILMLGLATAALVGNYLLTNFYVGSGNHHPHDKKKKLAPKTNAPDPLADTRRNELVIQSQSKAIIGLRQDNRDLVGQLEAISDHLDTCEAEALRTDQHLQALLRHHLRSKTNHTHLEDESPSGSKLTAADDEVDWKTKFDDMDTQNDELIRENNGLVDRLTVQNTEFNTHLTASQAAWQAMSDQNTELRVWFAKQLDEATRAFDLKTQDMQTKLEQATAEIAIAKQGKNVSKSSSKKKK